jgi:hypothetical protein
MFAATRPRAFACVIVSWLAAAAVCTLAHAEPASDADLSAPLEDTATSPCDPATSQRIDFIAQRLDERRRHARRWWMGFTSFYGIGTVVTSYQAARNEDAGERAVDAVSAVKAAFGTTRLFFFDRPAALYGGVPVRKLLPDCDAALERGEQLLRDAAHETRSRTSWKRHLSIVGINAAGALIAGEGWGEREDAWKSAGIGVIVGEIMAWSHPWNGVRDLDEYHERFPSGGGPATPPVSWHWVPMPNGVAVVARF